MTLLTMHRILIGSGVAVFVLYALHEATSFAAGDGPGAAARGVLSIGAAVALVAYLRWLQRRQATASKSAPPQPPRA